MAVFLYVLLFMCSLIAPRDTRTANFRDFIRVFARVGRETINERERSATRAARSKRAQDSPCRSRFRSNAVCKIGRRRPILQTKIKERMSNASSSPGSSSTTYLMRNPEQSHDSLDRYRYCAVCLFLLLVMLSVYLRMRSSFCNQAN